MRVRIIFILICVFVYIRTVHAQLKFIVDDFEGFTNGYHDLYKNGFFAFGNANAYIEQGAALKKNDNMPDYIGERFITINKKAHKSVSGFGKGIGLHVELSPLTDYLNFYVKQPVENGPSNIKIQIQEDDNESQVYEKNLDDVWVCPYQLKADPERSNWQLVSVALDKFTDGNQGGDGIFNIGYKTGKLLCLIICFTDTLHADGKEQQLSFDFISFSKGRLSEEVRPEEDDHCTLGLWSTRGNSADFAGIATDFEDLFKLDSDKKPGVVHFFQPFAVDGGVEQNHYPSVERINEVIEHGYTPMITLENHFVNTKKKKPQPNLYSIVEGYMDVFFVKWAKQIKQINGTVLLRILHEFNGNWYPWCIENNTKNPEMLAQAFRHIHNIFKDQGVLNVKFIWCPNSMSVPQEKWNYIMDAYPGDEYVDYVGLDIYNGAGKESGIWRSFRKEGIENYFILTQQFPNKPLVVCETASRERNKAEAGPAQSKAEWIEQMSSALKSDMSKIKLLTWFNERGTFLLNSSPETQRSFLKNVLKDNYFKSGTKYLETTVTEK